MIRKNIVTLLLCFFVIPVLVLFMQNCAQSESSSSTTVQVDCSHELSCSDPSSNGDNICISGRVVDGVDRTANLTSATLSAIELRLYDAIAYFSNPTGTAPIKTLTAAAGDIDSCGRYSTRINVSTDTPVGYLGIIADDLGGTGSTYVNSAVVRSVGAYTNLVGVRNFLVTTAQDQAWSAAAGLSGTTFATSGTIAVRFYQYGNSTDPVPGVGAAGVAPTWNGGFIPAADYFFSDTGLKTMATIEPSQTVTGVNGVTFFIPPSAGPATASTTGNCTTIAGASGTITAAGSALLMSVPDVILFRDINVTCN